MGDPGGVKLGDRIEVYWDEEGLWFAGVVADQAEPGSRFTHRIQYDDDEDMWVSFKTASVLESLEEDGEDGHSSKERPYKPMGRAAAEPAPAVEQQEPPKRKRGRPPGSGKVQKARAAAAAAVMGKGQGLGAALPPEQQASRKKKARKQQQQQQQQHPTRAADVGSLRPPAATAPVESGAQQSNPALSLRVKLQSMVKGEPTGSPAATAPSAASMPHPQPEASQQPAAGRPRPSGAANGAPDRPGSWGQTGAAGLTGAAGASPRAAAQPQPQPAPSSLGGPRDPRKAAPAGSARSPAKQPRREGGGSAAAATAAQPSEQLLVQPPSLQPQQQEQEQEPGQELGLAGQQPLQAPAARPAPAPPAVTVIGFQFSSELATISAAEEDDASGLRTGGSGSLLGSSRGTTPRGPRRSTSHGPEGFAQAAGTTPGTAEAGGEGRGVPGEDEPGAAAVAALAGGGGSCGVPSEEEIERQVACRNFERMLVGLTRTKEAIGRATGLALQAAKCNTGPRLVRMVLERMGAEESNQQRVNLLYLIDSILQTSVREREGRTDCGPQSPAGQAYPRVVGAALTRLVEAVARDVQAAEKLEKVLLIWQRKAIISDTLMEPALLLARTKRAQHDAAWGEVDLSAPPAASNAAGALGAAAAGAGPAGGPSVPGMGPVAAAAAGAPGGGAAGVKRPMSGPEGEAALWRMWRRLPMNAVLLFKFIDQKSGHVLQMTQRPQSSQWEDMDALRAAAEARGIQVASPKRADQPAFGPSPSSSWEAEDGSLGTSPPPNASPWHWESMREARRSAAAAAAQQEQAERTAAAAAAAAQAAQWAQLAASSKAQRAEQQQGGVANEPDEFEQEMLQQMAGGTVQAAYPGPSSQQDPWSQLATMEVDAAEGGLYGAAPWNLPGAAMAAAAAAAPAGGERGAPPLPAELPPLPEGAPPPPLPEDDFDEGPPPLPAYSPPHDEYAPAEFGGLPPLPTAPPPPEDDDDLPMDLMGLSPHVPPPLPPGEGPPSGRPAPHLPPSAGEHEPPLLPPGIGVGLRRPPPQQQPPLPLASSTPGAPPPAALRPLPPPLPGEPTGAHPAAAAPPMAHHPALPPAMVTAVAAALARPRPPVSGRHALRTWTGFVTELVPGSHGVVDGNSPESAFFVPAVVRGPAAGPQVGDRVRCEGEEWAGGRYKWRVTSIQLERGADARGEDEGFEEDPAAYSDLPPGFQQHHSAHEQLPPQQQPRSLQEQGRVASWHGSGSGSFGDMADAALLEGPPPGFAARGPPALGQPQAAQPWPAAGPHGGGGAAYSAGYAAAQHQHYAAMTLQAMQPPQQPPSAAAWSMQQKQQQQQQQLQQQQVVPGGGYPPGWGPH